MMLREKKKKKRKKRHPQILPLRILTVSLLHTFTMANAKQTNPTNIPPLHDTNEQPPLEELPKYGKN
jgi:hypothetical protein